MLPHGTLAVLTVREASDRALGAENYTSDMNRGPRNLLPSSHPKAAWNEIRVHRARGGLMD